MEQHLRSLKQQNEGLLSKIVSTRSLLSCMSCKSLNSMLMIEHKKIVLLTFEKYNFINKKIYNKGECGKNVSQRQPFRRNKMFTYSYYPSGSNILNKIVSNI